MQLVKFEQMLIAFDCFDGRIEAHLFRAPIKQQVSEVLERAQTPNNIFVGF